MQLAVLQLTVLQLVVFQLVVFQLDYGGAAYYACAGPLRVGGVVSVLRGSCQQDIALRTDLPVDKHRSRDSEIGVR